jgi:hypothetical protein
MKQPLGQSAFDSPINEGGLRRLEYERPVRQWALLLAKSFVVALLYYVLAAASLKLHLSTSTLALVWPSNALLVATLALSPRRHWWVYLVAIIPTHILALHSYHVGFWWMTYQLLYNVANNPRAPWIESGPAARGFIAETAVAFATCHGYNGAAFGVQTKIVVS